MYFWRGPRMARHIRSHIIYSASDGTYSGKQRLSGYPRLADFIQSHTDSIVAEWEAFARTLIPAANNMTPLALRDHIREILAFIVSDMVSPQSRLEQVQKSQG